MADTQGGTAAGTAPETGGVLGFLARFPLPVLALLCVALWLPGIVNLPGLDRDESRFAQASRQMVESGNYVDIRLGQVPRYKKPVGIYWLQAVTTSVAKPFVGTQAMWSYRLASLLGAILAVWLTVWSARAVLDARGAFLAGTLMAGMLILAAEATIATTDAVLLACCAGMQGVWLRVYKAARDPGAVMPGQGLVMAGWVALGLGILVKGPVAPALAAVTLLGVSAWDRQFAWLKRLRPLSGLVIVMAIVLPWLIAIAIASKGAFFQDSLGDDFAAKLAGGQESHGAPPGYFLALSAVTLWPAILFVVPAVVAAAMRHREALIRFLLVWAAGWWLIVEITPTKLPHYAISAYPALAILAAAWLRGIAVMGRWEKIAAGVSGLQFVIGAAGLAAALVLLPRLYGPGDILWLWAAAGAGVVLSLAALVLFFIHRRGWSLAAMTAAALVFYPVLLAGAGPRLDQLWTTQRLAAETKRHWVQGDPPPVLAGYDEPSMLFALGADLGLSDGKGAAQIAARNGGLALVEMQERGPFLARLAELQADAVALATLDGFNYSRGKKVAITLYRVTPVAP